MLNMDKRSSLFFGWYWEKKFFKLDIRCMPRLVKEKRTTGISITRPYLAPEKSKIFHFNLVCTGVKLRSPFNWKMLTCLLSIYFSPSFHFCIFLYLPLCFYVSLYLCISLPLSLLIYVSLSLSLYICLFTSVTLSLSLYLCLFISVSLSLSISFFVSPLNCVSSYLCLYIYLFFLCFSLCLSLFISVSLLSHLSFISSLFIFHSLFLYLSLSKCLSLFFLSLQK